MVRIMKRILLVERVRTELSMTIASELEGVSMRLT